MLSTVPKDKTGSMTSVLSPKVWIVMLWISSRGMCDWDIRLTCPMIWYHGDKITLVCELNKGGVKSKCHSRTNNTDFKLNSGSRYRRQCLINPLRYANCNMIQTNNASACTCQENSTFFSLLYQFNADKLQHNGTWTCVDGCSGKTSAEYPLKNINSEYCKNVTIIDKGKDGGSIIGPQVMTHLLSLFVLFLEVSRYFRFPCSFTLQ